MGACARHLRPTFAAAALLLVWPGSSAWGATATASASGFIDLSVEFSGAQHLLGYSALADGSPVLGGYGAHYESALGDANFTGEVWTLKLYAEAFAESEPTSGSKAKYVSPTGEFLTFYNDPAFGRDERFELTFSSSVFFNVATEGEHANAAMRGEYLIYANHVGLGLAGVNFAPSESLVAFAPPTQAYSYNRLETWQFFMAPGDRFTVQLKSASIRALARTAVPEPTTWALLIAGFGVTGAALRQRGPQAA